MGYKINGVDLLLNPESCGWKTRSILNLDGNGLPIYPPTREYEMRWSYMSPAQYDQILGFYNAVGATGSAVVDLPKWGTDPYAFFSYSGCALQEPTVGPFEMMYMTSVVLVITRIRT